MKYLLKTKNLGKIIWFCHSNRDKSVGNAFGGSPEGIATRESSSPHN